MVLRKRRAVTKSRQRQNSVNARCCSPGEGGVHYTQAQDRSQTSCFSHRYPAFSKTLRHNSLPRTGLDWTQHQGPQIGCLGQQHCAQLLPRSFPLPGAHGSTLFKVHLMPLVSTSTAKMHLLRQRNGTMLKTQMPRDSNAEVGLHGKTSRGSRFQRLTETGCTGPLEGLVPVFRVHQQSPLSNVPKWDLNVLDPCSFIRLR